VIYPAVYDELVDFVADHAAPAKLIPYRSGDEAQERCSDLLSCEKNEGLLPDETKELDSFLSLGDAMLWVKARAHRWAGERQRVSERVAMLPRLVCDELVDFVADNAAPEKLVTFQSCDEARERCSDLLFREKYEGLTPDETRELDAFGSLGHVMLWAKARAHRWVGESRVYQQ
jgi:hypothetical protein